MAWINGFQVWLSETQSLNNAQMVVDFLYVDGKDWSKESIAALVGNMRHESSVNPNMYEYGYSESADRGFGMVQWTPRSKFWNWARDKGYTEAQRRSGDAQLARIDFEVENNIQYIKNGHQRRYGRGTKYDFSFADFRSNKPKLSVNQLTEAFMWNYEGPNYTAGSNSLGDRRAFANKAISELDWTKGGVAPTDPIPDPTDPVPEPVPEDDPEEPDDTPGGINIKGFMDELNQMIEKMLTADVYKAGGSDYYKTTFKMQVRELDSSISEIETPAYLFTHLDIDFVIHRPLHKNKEWTVSEPITGMRVSPNYKKREDAAYHVVHILNTVGKDKVLERIKQARDRS